MKITSGLEVKINSREQPNLDDKIFIYKSMYQAIESWSKTIKDLKVNAYIDIDSLITDLQRDKEKIQLIKKLDHPYNYTKPEIGIEIDTDSEMDDYSAVLDSLINYIDMLIHELKNHSERIYK